MSDERFDRILTDKGVLRGRPGIRGKYIEVGEIMRLTAEGLSIDEVLKKYPQLDREDVEQALAYSLEFGDNCFLPKPK